MSTPYITNDILGLTLGQFGGVLGALSFALCFPLGCLLLIFGLRTFCFVRGPTGNLALLAAIFGLTTSSTVEDEDFVAIWIVTPLLCKAAFITVERRTPLHLPVHPLLRHAVDTSTTRFFAVEQTALAHVRRQCVVRYALHAYVTLTIPTSLEAFLNEGTLEHILHPRQAKARHHAPVGVGIVCCAHYACSLIRSMTDARNAADLPTHVANPHLPLPRRSAFPAFE